MIYLLKKITIPYHLTHWASNLVTALPQIISGFLMLLFWTPYHFGLPWSVNGLQLFEVAPDYLAMIEALGGIFSRYPRPMAYLIIGIELVVALLFIFRLGIRLASFIFFIKLVTILALREFDGTWHYTPYFSMISVSLLGLWFGSGKYGFDYLVSKKLDWI